MTHLTLALIWVPPGWVVAVGLVVIAVLIIVLLYFAWERTNVAVNKNSFTVPPGTTAILQSALLKKESWSTAMTMESGTITIVGTTQWCKLATTSGPSILTTVITGVPHPESPKGGTDMVEVTGSDSTGKKYDPITVEIIVP